MYHIFVKTPVYKNTNYLPHLLEHCIVNGGLVSEKDFINYYNDIDAHTMSWYTQYSCETKKSVKVVMENFSKPILVTKIRHEKKRIADEYTEAVYSQRLFDRIQKDFSKTPISILKKIAVTQEEIQKYQKKYYKTYIVADKKYRIVQTTQTKNKSKTSSTFSPTPFHNYKKNLYSQKIIKLEGWENIVLYKKYDNAGDIFMGDFMSTLFSAWIDYHTTNITPQYHIDSVNFFKTEDYIVCTIPKEHHDIITSLSSDFFVEYKNYFCKNLLNNLPNILSILAGKKQVELKLMKKIIQSLKLEEIVAIV